MTRQETINKAVAWALGIAQDDRYGYDQANRWGPNYDCSSFVISAWQYAGVPVKKNGATYTGNMYAAFLKSGFVDVTRQVNLYTAGGMKKGDVLLNTSSHTELYIGDGKNVKASINENGGITGGKSGDQTGREICVGPYYNYPWNYILRYNGDGSDDGSDEKVEEPKKEEPKKEESKSIQGLPMLRRGDRGLSVVAMQGILIARGYGCGPDGADGVFGENTGVALRKFQNDFGLEADEICGPMTWAKLLGV